MKILGLILLIALMVSCGQSPKSLSVGINKKFYISKNSKSCKQVDLYKDIISKNNILNLFQCLGYEKKYSTIYDEIKNTKSESFIAFNETLNKTYLKDSKTRDLLLGLIVSKTKKESSSSLSHLVKSFFKDTNNLSALKEMTSSLKKSNTKVSVQFLFSYLNFMADLDHSTEIQRKKLNTSFSDPQTKKYFSIFLEVFFKDILIDNGPEKEAFVSFLGDGVWLESLFNDINANSFKKITSFVSSHKDFQEGIYKYKEGIETDSYNCSSQSKSYIVDHSVELKWQLENLYYLNQPGFELEMVNLMTRFNLYSQICYDDKFIPSIQKLLSKFVSFIKIDGGFTILNNFAKLSVSSGFDYKTIINFFTSDSFNELKLLLDSLKEDANFNDSVFNLLKSLGPKDILNVSSILEALQKDEQFLSSLSKIWNEDLSRATKDMLIGYVVDMFLTDKDIYPAFDFLNVVVSNMPIESEILFNDLIFDANNDLQNLLSELVINSKLQSEVVKFLDDNSLFDLLSIIQKSDPLTIDSPEDLADEDPLVQSSNELGNSCLNYLSNIDPENTLEELVTSYPSSCLGVETKKENFALKIIRWSKAINADFLYLFNNSFTSKKGILYKDTMHFLHQMVHVTTKHVKSAEDFSKATVDSVKDFFFKERKIEQLELGITKLVDLENSDQTITKVLDNTIEITGNQFDETLKVIFEAMNNFTSSGSTYNCLNRESCNFNLKAINLELSKNNLRLNKQVLNNVLDELSSGVYVLEDYIELIRFIGENKAYKAVALEKILNSVDFSNGYYSAFFISKLSKSTNYTDTTEQLKKDFRLANKLSGTFKFLNFFPNDINDRFKVVLDNIAVLDEFDKTVPGRSYKYGDVLIQLAKVLTKLSPKKSQNLVKISLPRSKKVYGHYSHYLLTLSKKGYLTELANYISENLDEIKSRNLDFDLIRHLIKLTSIKGGIDSFRIDTFPVNKKLVNQLLKISNTVQSTLLSYLKVMPKFSISTVSSNSQYDFYKYNKLFKILADKDVDYLSLHSALVRVHGNNPDYINQLLNYSIVRNNGKSNIELALENMFINSNDSLILFFKDILAHFRLK